MNCKIFLTLTFHDYLYGVEKFAHNWVKQRFTMIKKIGFSIAIMTLLLSLIIVSASASTGKIVGIDPGAGVMQKAETAIEEYDLDFDLVASSSAGMASELTKKINKEEWVVVTGWTPHWKFVRYDLKYLDDPKEVFGEKEEIFSLARVGFEEDNPGAYEILERFEWSFDDINSVMLSIEEGANPEDAALEFINNNEVLVSEWIGDVTGDGTMVTIGYVLWDCAIASTNTLAKVFEKAGFNVELKAVDAGVLYQAIAKGDVDCMTTAWLPVTHSMYIEKYGDDLVIVRKNMDGVAGIGLVVPTYVTIDSIDDLNSVADKFF